MSILDELKREAERARTAKAAEESRGAEQERIYQQEIVPRLIRIHAYLQELVEHLQAANRQVEVRYDLPAFGSVGSLYQSNYRFKIDSQRSPKKVSVEFECMLPIERTFAIAAANAEEARQFLQAHEVVFSEWPSRDGLGQVSEVNFKGRLRVRCGLVFEADTEASCIRVMAYNMEGLTTRDYRYAYDRIDDAWLDGLGRYVLRKDSQLLRLYLPDDTRQRLRILAEQEKKDWGLPGQEEQAPDTVQPGRRGLFRSLRDKWLNGEKPD